MYFLAKKSRLPVESLGMLCQHDLFGRKNALVVDADQRNTGKTIFLNENGDKLALRGKI
jgi:hypothetical protein